MLQRSLTSMSELLSICPSPPLTPSRPEINNIDVADWFTKHMKYLKPLVGLGYELSTPVVTTGEPGFIWLKSFMGMCGGNCGVCTIFAIIPCALMRPGRSLS